VPLAGDQEVVVAVQPQLDGAAGLVRGQRRPDGQVAGLRFLAAEAAAHAPAFDRTALFSMPSACATQCCTSPGAGCWSRSTTGPAPAARVGDLAFQVEVFLAADLERAGSCVRDAASAAPVRRGARSPAAARSFASHAPRARPAPGRQRLDVQLDLARGAARLHHGVGHHQADHLADVLDRVAREHRLVVDEGRQHRIAGDVGRQDHGAHAGHGQGVVSTPAACRAPTVDRMGAACSVPRTSAMSSM
jgi:hypothetical protein